MKKLTAMLLALLLMSMSATAFAEVDVEDGENLPPPMVVTYEYVAPPTITVTIPAYTPDAGDMYVPTKPTT